MITWTFKEWKSNTCWGCFKKSVHALVVLVFFNANICLNHGEWEDGKINPDTKSLLPQHMLEVQLLQRSHMIQVVRWESSLNNLSTFLIFLKCEQMFLIWNLISKISHPCQNWLDEIPIMYSKINEDIYKLISKIPDLVSLSLKKAWVSVQISFARLLTSSRSHWIG